MTDAAYGFKSRFAVFSAHVQVSDKTHIVRVDAGSQDVVLGQLAAEFSSVHTGGADIEDEYVGYDFAAGGHFFESNQSGRSEDSGLTHAATQCFAIDACLLNECLAAQQHGTHRRSEAFGKTEHHRIEFSGDLRHGLA